MKRTLLLSVLAMALATPALAEGTMTTERTMGLGLDFAMPYTLRVNGNSNRERANLNIGVDGRYYYTENVNFGARFAFDMEERTGTTRQITLMPGMQYIFMPNEMWNPFLRLDLPVILRGAPNTSASTGKQDIGLSGGAGLAWNLGDAIGVNNLALRYDFAMTYFFGMGSAVDVLALDIFKIGFDYRF